MPHFSFTTGWLFSLWAFAQHREITAESQDENGDIHQTNTGVDPVPLDAARQQDGGDHRENHARHAKEGVGKQQTRPALTAFIHMGDQEGPDRHGDPAHRAKNEH